MDKLDFVEMREELEQVLRPEFGPLLAAGKRRRTLVHGGAAAAGVAAIVVAVLVGTQFLTGSAAMVPPPLPVAVAGPLHGAELPLSQPAELKEVAYANQWQAYALLKTSGGDLAVGRTQDGGKSWQAWKMPSGVTTKNSATLIDVLGGQTIVVKDSPSPTETHTYLSRDGGQTWSTPKDFGPKIDQVPAGWKVGMDVPPAPRPSESRWIVAYDPDTGLMSPLRSRDGKVAGLGEWTAEIDTSVFEAHDGSLWMPSWQQNHAGAPMVSTDRGATWHSGEVAAPGGNYGVTNFSSWDSYDGKTGYATVDVRPTVNGTTRDYHLSPFSKENALTHHLGYPDERTMMYVTRDGGRTWQPVQPGVVTAVNYGPVVVTSDGAVLAVEAGRENSPPITSMGTLVASHDSGRNFAAVPGIGEIDDLDHSGSDQIRTTELSATPGRGGALFSKDGSTWTPGPKIPWPYAN